MHRCYVFPATFFWIITVNVMMFKDCLICTYRNFLISFTIQRFCGSRYQLNLRLHKVSHPLRQLLPGFEIKIMFFKNIDIQDKHLEEIWLFHKISSFINNYIAKMLSHPTFELKSIMLLRRVTSYLVSHIFYE